jgi:hypothetical protein
MVRVALTISAVATCIAIVAACSEEATAPTVAPGDDLVDDTMDSDSGGAPPAAASDAAMDTAPPYPDSGYSPML